MGDGKIGAELFSERLTLTKLKNVAGTAMIIAALLGVALVCFPQQAMAGSKSASELTAIEHKLFMKTYEQDPTESRVARIEKQVFGEAMTGEISERLERITSALGPQKNPDGSISGIKKETPRSVSPPAQQEQQSSPQGPDISEQQAAQERAQLAVQAAREEQINHLLTEGANEFRAKRKPEAVEKFEKVLRLDPHNAQALFSMGVVFEQMGNYPRAMACYQKVSEENPDNKEYSEALMALKRKGGGRAVSAGAPSQMGALAEEAKAAYERGEFVSALSFYKELETKFPNEALVKYNIATCYLATKNPYSALEYYKEAYRLKPNETRYAVAYQKLQGQMDAARQERERVEQQWAENDPQGRGMPPGGGGNAMGNGGLPTPPPAKQQKKIKQPKSSAPIVSNQPVTDQFLSIGLVGKSGKGGVAVTTVGLASRAYQAGFQPGDVIKAVDGVVVKSVDDINKALSRKPAGAQVQMTVQRGATMGQVTL